MKPAPLQLIRQKLSSSDPRSRLVALRHAAAHQEAAVSLAPVVAAMLEDEDSSVQWQAVGTFRTIGRGAAEAVPVLLKQFEGEGEHQSSRAIFCLGCIGPEAAEAVPRLKAAYKRSPEDDKLLQALYAIAPTDPEVIELIVSAAFSADFIFSRAALDALSGTDGPAIDRVFSKVASRAQSSDAMQRFAAAMVLESLIDKKPEHGQELLAEFLTNPQADETWPAVAAVAKLPQPRPPQLIDSLVVVVSTNVEASERALETLSKIGPEAQPARDVLLEVIRTNSQAEPVSGEEGTGAQCLAHAATALANSGPCSEATPLILDWTKHVLKRAPRRALSWYPVGQTVEALARLAPALPEAENRVVELVAAARKSIDRDEPGVLDFERSVRRAIGYFSSPEKLWKKVEKLGMTKIDPFEDTAAPETKVLPEFPEEEGQELRPNYVLESLRAADSDTLNSLIAEGYACLDLDADSCAPNVAAEIVEQWVRRLKRQGGKVTKSQLSAVGAAFGKAVADQTGWQWHFYTHETDQRWALCSLDQSYLHLPVDFIENQLRKDKEVTVLLFFNMLTSARLPKARAGALSQLS